MLELKRLSVKGILIGFAVDFVGSAILAMLVGVFLGARLASKGLSPTQISDQLSQSTAMALAGLIIGLAFSIVGGYIAATIANDYELQNGLVEGVCSTVIGLLSVACISKSGPVWFNILAFLLTIPSATFGGYLRTTHNR